MTTVGTGTRSAYGLQCLSYFRLHCPDFLVSGNYVWAVCIHCYPYLSDQISPSSPSPICLPFYSNFYSKKKSKLKSQRKLVLYFMYWPGIQQNWIEILALKQSSCVTKTSFLFWWVSYSGPSAWKKGVESPRSSLKRNVWCKNWKRQP